MEATPPTNPVIEMMTLLSVSCCAVRCTTLGSLTVSAAAIFALLLAPHAQAETYGAASFNDRQVAYALSSLDPADVAGTPLGMLREALRTAGDASAARAGLRSLGGAGLAGLQKVLAGDSTQHLQTLRAQVRSLHEGNPYADLSTAEHIPVLGSGVLTAAMTGGSARVEDRRGEGDYTRDNLGFMLTGLSPLDEHWSFACSFAYSASNAQCAAVDIEADAYYSDFAILYNRGRLHQVATMGAGLFSFDTSRSVGVPGGASFSSVTGGTSATTVTFSYEISYDLVRSGDSRHAFAPVAIAEATFAQFKDMHESGAGNAGLHADWDNLQCLTVGTGFRYTYRFEVVSQPGFFCVDVLTLATSGDDTMSVTSQFLGGGSSFELWGPKAGGSALRLNATTYVPLGNTWALQCDVSAEFRSHENCIHASLGAAYRFLSSFPGSSHFLLWGAVSHAEGLGHRYAKLPELACASG